MTDEERVITAVRRAQQLLESFFESGHCPIETVQRVNAVMNDTETLVAFHRLYGRQIWDRPVENRREPAEDLDPQPVS